MALAVAQMGPVHLADSRAAVVGRLVAMLREAAGRGAEFIVFPELALTTFFPRYWMSEEEAVERFFEKSMPNADVQPLFEAARRLAVGFYLGYAEITADGRRFNTSILVDRSANIIGKYRKIHLPGHAEHKPDAPFQHLEKKFFEVGDRGFGVWQMGLAQTQAQGQVNIGMCLCNDRRWPETYRVMALQSAELIVLGYNTPTVNIHWNEPAHWRTTSHEIVLQAGAYQNAVWVGSSMIVAPSGEIVARAQYEDDEVIVANIDLALGEDFRQHVFNFAKHRSPQHYRLIVERTGAGEPLPQPEAG